MAVLQQITGFKEELLTTTLAWAVDTKPPAVVTVTV
jgi:hypothetical protein